MGVPIVFHYVANQPHTHSPHFASFPTGLPDYLFKVLFLTTPPQYHEPSISSTISFPSANFPSFHLPYTETHPWGPHPPPVLQANCALLGQPCYIGAPVSVVVHLSQSILYLLHKRLCFQHLHYLFVVTFGDLLPFLASATHVALGWGTLYHLPLLTSFISSEYPIGHLPLPSEFIHFDPPLAQFISRLVVPLTLDLVEPLWPFILRI
jgi:hypothetical protein